MDRFQDGATYTVEFTDRILVECHRCGELGIVRCDPPTANGTPRFSCTRCPASLEGRFTFWAGPASGLARRRCGRCGRWLEEALRCRNGFGARELDLSCPGCGAENRAAVRWRGDPSPGAYDPFFGLPLRLQVACVGEVLWAYNQRHVEFLRAFVEAKLRERAPNANRSLASRLPAWLKAASNREAVLRGLSELARRAVT